MLKCFFCSLRLTIKCSGVFGLVCTENRRKRLKASKNDWIRVACRFELFQFPQVANWNFSFTHTHMELRHAVATHQWTWKPVYYNYNIFFLQLIYFFNNWSMKNNETKAMQHQRVFLRMDFYLYFSFVLKRRRCWQFVLRIFEVKVFGDQKICAGDQI